MAMEQLEQADIKAIKDVWTIMTWNTYFRVYGTFPHPNFYVERGKEPKPRMWEIFPEAKDMVKHFANENLETLSSELVADYIRGELVDELFEKHNDECTNSPTRLEPLTRQEFLQQLHLKTIDPKTACNANPEDFKSQGLSYKEIEKFVDKEMKVHRSALDQDHGCISRTWRNAQWS